MILSRNYTSCLVIGAFAAGPLSVSCVNAEDYVTARPVTRIGDHCAQFGQGFVDVGNGICGRVTTHVRVYVGARNAAMIPSMDPWATSGTSTAAMRSEGMVPGAQVTHLRVRGGLDSFDPFH